MRARLEYFYNGAASARQTEALAAWSFKSSRPEDTGAVKDTAPPLNEKLRKDKFHYIILKCILLHDLTRCE